jgi:hypothetical protein
VEITDTYLLSPALGRLFLQPYAGLTASLSLFSKLLRCLFLSSLQDPGS